VTSPFVERLRQGFLLADGGMGTLLYARGVGYDHCFELLNIERPDLIRAVHADYLAAGARLIETNTFGGNAVRLAEHDLSGRAHELNLAGAQLARAVADTIPGTWVAGSVGPLGVHLAPIGHVAHERAAQLFADQVAALAAGGADVILIETMRDLDEALIALSAAHLACDLPVIVSVTFGEDGLTASGHTPEAVVAALEAAGADVIGANCSTGPAPMLDVMARMAAVTGTPLSAMPNAGLPAVVNGRFIYTSPPGYMGDVMAQMAATGVALVGGCCGTTPDHIAAIGAALAGGRPEGLRLSFPAPDEPGGPAPAALTGPTALARALGERFAVTVEVDPPRGFNFAAALPKLRPLAECGLVDALNVADSPRAQARMSALAMGALIQGELGLETVLHMGCRHRNLVAIHSELLGAHALGIRNMFVVMGDLPANGDYPDATVVNDITATGLMKLLATFNRGVDVNGRRLDQPTAFHVGCAFNFGAADLDRELALLEKKLESGARFALSQPVYEAGAVERAVDRLGGRFPVPVLVGVLPLWNARHAAFLHNEVPGIIIPAPVMDAMVRAGEHGRAAGVRLARELLADLTGAVQGAYFMPPFEKYDLVPEIVAGLRPVERPVLEPGS
jgi:methionine synthase / methylenetetrahydrofolate reductase(NADPH)